MTDTIESLRQQLAECRATNGKLREALFFNQDANTLNTQKQDRAFTLTGEALALPNDATALNELIAERTKELAAEVERLKKQSANRLIGVCTAGLSNDELRQQNAELTAQRDAAFKHIEWNRRIRDSVDGLLKQGGYHEESSARHQLSLMNFDAAIANSKEQGG